MSVTTETIPYPVLIERLKDEYTEPYAKAVAKDGITTCREHVRQYLRDIYPELHDRFCDEDYRNTQSEFDNRYHPRLRKNTR